YFFLYTSGDHRALHSFPTRRSSDLLPRVDQQAREIDRETVADVRVRIVDGNDELAVLQQFVVLGQELKREELADGSGLAQSVDRRAQIRRFATVEAHFEAIAEHRCLEIVDE